VVRFLKKKTENSKKTSKDRKPLVQPYKLGTGLVRPIFDQFEHMTKMLQFCQKTIIEKSTATNHKQESSAITKKSEKINNHNEIVGSKGGFHA
jgi:16S rRNA A1518/A1519 N6-dimethyltransferase RsmA/KsgA/DIM1 with predicted DNA glycosylase/AP lyase activity